MITMHKLFIFGLVTFFLVAPFIQNVEAYPESCDWLDSENLLLKNQPIEQDNLLINELRYEFIPNKFPTILECSFIEPVNFNNRLLNLGFHVESANDYDLHFAFSDVNGNQIISYSIGDWYGIPSNIKANISLNPFDFNKDTFDFSQITSFHIIAPSPNIDLIQFSQPSISFIEPHPTFSIFDNLPVQSIIPNFIFLIFISFPIGYVILYYSGFQKNQNFTIKLPYILGIGFVAFLVYSWSIANIKITFETILVYLVAEYLIFLIFLAKKKIKIERNFSGTDLFFAAIILFSGIFALSLGEVYGWPPDEWDSRAHASFTGLIMANNVLFDGTSYQPIADLPFEYAVFPKGFHAATASTSFMSDAPIITSMGSIFFFTTFLIPPILSTFVYRYTKSIFFSSLMFMLSYFKPMFEFWYGDIIFNKWVGGLLPSQIGIFIMLIFFMIFLEFFEKKPFNSKLFIPIIITIIGVFLTYYPILPIILMVGVPGIVFYLKDRKKSKIVISASFLILFMLLPLWAPHVLQLYPAIENFTVVNLHHKYLLTQPFEPNFPLFPFWVSSAIALTASVFLIRYEKYRYFSLIIIIISLIPILTIYRFLTEHYFFYIQMQRSLGLMFLPSITTNLFVIYQFVDFIIN